MSKGQPTSLSDNVGYAFEADGNTGLFANGRVLVWRGLLLIYLVGGNALGGSSLQLQVSGLPRVTVPPLPSTPVIIKGNLAVSSSTLYMGSDFLNSNVDPMGLRALSVSNGGELLVVNLLSDMSFIFHLFVHSYCTQKW